MKREKLIARISKESKVKKVTWELARHGKKHDIYSLGNLVIPVPRHTEIKELTAVGIFEECEPELGRDWWKK